MVLLGLLIEFITMCFAGADFSPTGMMLDYYRLMDDEHAIARITAILERIQPEGAPASAAPAGPWVQADNLREEAMQSLSKVGALLNL